MKKNPLHTALVYLLLGLGASLFSAPLLWMFSTALKPVEQTVTVPPTWLPRATYAELNGKRMEVTLDYPLHEAGELVRFSEGPYNNTQHLLPAGSYDATSGTALWTGTRVKEEAEADAETEPVAAQEGVRWRAELLRRAEPGWWHITERSPTRIRTRELLTDIQPEDQLDSRILPRWNNFPLALATIGGRSIDVVEGTLPPTARSMSPDAEVPFMRFVWNTVLVCGLGVIGAVLSNALVAYGLAKLRWPGRDWLFGITLSTMMVPFPVLMVPLYEVFKNLGWIGTLQPLWVPSYFGAAFNIFLMRQFFLTIPDDLSEAARIDGCSEFRIFWQIILPLSKPVLAVVALFHFIYAWNDFMAPLLYLTRPQTFTLALALQNFQSQQGGVLWHLLMAASCVITIPIIILFFFTQKTFIRGIATTGLKG